MSATIPHPATAPTVARTAHPNLPPALQRSDSRWRRAVIATAALVVAWAFAPFILVALDAAAHHRTFLGVAGYYPMDGVQYLAWIRDAHDGLIRSLYGSHVGKPVFVHPMYSLTGLLQGLVGISPALIMGFWKAVSAVVLFAGCVKATTLYVPRRRRPLALILALFGGLTPLAALLPLLDPWQAGADFARAAGDLVPAMALWDYAPLAIALGLMPFVIERLEGILSAGGDRRAGWTAAALGLLVAWLHPWQGITLIAIAAGLVLRRLLELRGSPGDARRRVVRAVLPMVIATGAPVLYYLLLSRVDAGWATSELNSVSAAFIPMSVAVACEAPLALLGLFAGWRCRRDAGALPLLLWPLGTLLTIAVSPSGQYRALDGFAIPIVLLAVRTWPRRQRIPALAALAAALVPFAFFAVGAFGHLRSRTVTGYTELAPADVRAIETAARAPGAGPLLAPEALGTAIPALTDSLSWVGHPIWTPDYGIRKQQSAELFGGGLPPDQVRALVRTLRPRALVAPCAMQANLAAALAPLGYVQTRVGCARVYAHSR